MRSSLVPALATLCLLVTSCTQDATPPKEVELPGGASKQPTSATDAERTDGPTPGAANGGAGTPDPYEGPTGSITGAVTLSGDAPTMPLLKRGTDPACKGEARSREVLTSGDKLQNVVVRLRGEVPATEYPTEPVVVDQKGCLYQPRVQAALDGQKLRVTNSDATLHNVHSYKGKKTVFNVAQPPKGRPISKDLPKADGEGAVKLECDVHPWMVSWIVVNENAHFAVTDESGAFTLEGVPPGSYTLETWHERYGVKTQTVEVKADEAAEVTFSYDAANDRRG